MLRTAWIQEQEALHAALTQLNRARLAPATPTDDARAALVREHAWRVLELEFLETELASVRMRASQAPRTGEAFVAWFEDLERTGPGQGDPLFPWLATAARVDEVIWFLKQEVSGEASFEDLVALVQASLREAGLSTATATSFDSFDAAIAFVADHPHRYVARRRRPSR